MTSKLPPGIYRIDVASGGGVERECLTRQGEKGVTILPPSAQPNPQQEVIHRFLTSSIVFRSPAILVASHRWQRWQRRHREAHRDLTNLLPYLRRRSQET
jgi:hypothetical protein